MNASTTTALPAGLASPFVVWNSGFRAWNLSFFSKQREEQIIHLQHDFFKYRFVVSQERNLLAYLRHGWTTTKKFNSQKEKKKNRRNDVCTREVDYCLAPRTDRTTRIPSGVASPITTHDAAKGCVFISTSCTAASKRCMRTRAECSRKLCTRVGVEGSGLIDSAYDCGVRD